MRTLCLLRRPGRLSRLEIVNSIRYVTRGLVMNLVFVEESANGNSNRFGCATVSGRILWMARGDGKAVASWDPEPYPGLMLVSGIVDGGVRTPERIVILAIEASNQ